MERIGLLSDFASKGVKQVGFHVKVWKPDGSCMEKSAAGMGSLGYTMQRPTMIKILESCLSPGDVVRGALTDINFDGKAIVQVILKDGTESHITASMVFGCDGRHSRVREILQKIDSEFTMSSVGTPSTGFVYKAMLYRPPQNVDPKCIYRIVSMSGFTLLMFPHDGPPGEPRPLQMAQAPSHRLHSFQAPSDLIDFLRAEFPQLEVDKHLDIASAEAWCNTRGTAFPRAQWCKRASAEVSGVPVALLGDALHCFPPDLGQGINAGLVDVCCLLDLFPSDVSNKDAMRAAFKAYEACAVKEAEAICRLIPVGFPYQYQQPFSLSKFLFMSSFLIRMVASKLLPTLFFDPVVVNIQADPPLLYSEILRRHQQVSGRLLLCSGVFMAVCAASWKRFRI